MPGVVGSACGLALLLVGVGAEAQWARRCWSGRGAADLAERQFWQERRAAGFWSETGPGSQQGGPVLPAPPYSGGGWFMPPLYPLCATKPGLLTLEDYELVADGQGGFRGERPAYSLKIDRDGSLHFRDHVNLDLTDLVMRARGEDPYAFDKRRARELTETFRASMSESDRRDRIERALAALPAQLAAISSRPDLPPDARRQVFDDLWDEFAEGPTPEGHAADLARIIMRPYVER